MPLADAPWSQGPSWEQHPSQSPRTSSVLPAQASSCQGPSGMFWSSRASNDTAPARVTWSRRGATERSQPAERSQGWDRALESLIKLEACGPLTPVQGELPTGTPRRPLRRNTEVPFPPLCFYINCFILISLPSHGIASLISPVSAQECTGVP